MVATNTNESDNENLLFIEEDKVKYESCRSLKVKVELL